jgi:glutamate synthase (NADPH/NADH) large chain
MIRDLLKVKTLDTPLDISEIEPLESILKRFDSAGISWAPCRRKLTKPWPKP